jgi:hypothetical protein
MLHKLTIFAAALCFLVAALTFPWPSFARGAGGSHFAHGTSVHGHDHARTRSY